MTDQYAVMGYPVAHSKSPRIHARFAKQTEQALEYTALAVEPGTFPGRVATFFGSGGKGLNVTVPYKQEAWELAEERSADATMAGAVNTLFLKGGRLQGHNTDGIGLVRDVIENHRGVLTGRSILILGAGGATRGILLPFLRQQPARICIANRTVSKAEELAEHFQDEGEVTACGFADLAGQSFDWVFNASSASLQGELPPLPQGLIHRDSWCYDLMYGKEPTVFCQWAARQGAARSLDGLGMLVEQAAEAFWLWRGVKPQTAPVIAELRGL